MNTLFSFRQSAGSWVGRRFAAAVLGVSIMAGGFFLPAGVAWACSCIMPGSAQEEAENRMVFAGQAVNVAERSDKNTITFTVYEWHKNGMAPDDAATFTIDTPRDSAACGYSFEEGKEYLVYADSGQGQGTPMVTLCSRTTELSNAVSDLEELGMETRSLASGGSPQAGTGTPGGVVPLSPDTGEEEGALRGTTIAVLLAALAIGLVLVLGTMIYGWVTKRTDR